MADKKRNPWRPAKYDNPEDLQAKIEEYFHKGVAVREVFVGKDKTPVLMKVPTMSGLVLYCGFADRNAFFFYEQKPLFSSTIKRARECIAQHYEELLQTGLGACAIFALKNFGWRDIAETVHSGSVNFMFTTEERNARVDRLKAMFGGDAGRG